MDLSSATPPPTPLRISETTRVIPSTSPVTSVAFGPRGNVAMLTGSRLKEYDADRTETRIVTNDLGNRTFGYDAGTGSLRLDPPKEGRAEAVVVTDSDARRRLSAVGLPFARIQQDTIRLGKDGPEYVAWTDSRTGPLTGTVFSGPVRVIPSEVVVLAESDVDARVIMEGSGIHTILRTPDGRTVVRCGSEPSEFHIPPAPDLSTWTSVIRTRRHALVSGIYGHITDLRHPCRIAESPWKIIGDPHRLPGGAATEAHNGSRRTLIWLHEDGFDCLPATSPLKSLVRTGPRELTGWHMRGLQLVIRTYALPRD
ncbi:MAG: hypothetical protein WCO25_01430 [Candidatus Uhrbacteria bacterium]